MCVRAYLSLSVCLSRVHGDDLYLLKTRHLSLCVCVCVCVREMRDDIPPSTLLFLVTTCEQQPHDIDPDL